MRPKLLFSFLLFLNIHTILQAQKPVKNDWYNHVRPTETYLSLNGQWNFNHTTADRNDLWKAPEKYDSLVTIPEYYNYKYSGGVLPRSKDLLMKWYEKRFVLSKELEDGVKKGNVIFIHFGGIAWRWSAWLNGHKITVDNPDALNEQNFEVTSYLNIKGENILIIGATDSHGLAENLKYARHFETVKADRDGDFISPAPEVCPDPSVWGEIELWSRPRSRMEDIFIIPGYREKNLRVSLEIMNPQKGKILIQLTDKDNNPVDVNILPVPVIAESLPVVIETEFKWYNPRLWRPEDPFLYYALITYYNDKGKLIDKQKVRFGFRELWIEGNNLMMNGRRLFLARNSIITPHEHTLSRVNEVNINQSIREQFEILSQKWKPYNSINSLRIHRSGFIRPGAFAWYADELGIMLVPETATPMGDRFVVTNPEFWKNSKVYLERWVKSGRNYPSIVLWSLTNEFLWCGAQRENPDCHELMYEQEQFVKKVDPTRFIGWDGDWDLPALKKPLSGRSETVNLHYPFESSMNWFPTECWLFTDFLPENPIPVRGHYGTYNWPAGNKPIIVGEYAWNHKNNMEGPAAMTKYTGDRAYDWDYWATGKIQRKVIKWQTDAWRVARYAGLNPWTGGTKTHFTQMPLETVIIRDPERSYEETSTVNLQAYLLNDTHTDRKYRVEYRLVYRRDSTEFKPMSFTVKGGDMIDFVLPVTLPFVKDAGDYKLVIALNRDNRVVNREEYSLRVRPKVTFCWPEGVVLYDPSGLSTGIFRQLGMHPAVISNLSEGMKSKGIVLGINSLSKMDLSQQLKCSYYVTNGGKLFIMGENALPASLGIKAATNRNRSNHAWVRSKDHAVMKGIDDIDLGFWGENHWVNEYSYIKPHTDNGFLWRTLADAGSTNGLENAVLAEVFQGNGAIILNQLDFAQAENSPGCKALLINLLNYLRLPVPKKTDVSLILEENSIIGKYVKGAGVKTTEWEKTDYDTPLFIDANSENISLTDLSAWVSRGGKVWLSNIDRENFRRWSEILKVIKVEPIEPFDGALITSRDNLLWGISNEELFWCEGEWTAVTATPNATNRGTTITKMANIGSVAFTCDEATFSPLTQPSVMAVLNQGRGRWLLTSVELDSGIIAVNKKCGRLIRGILTNFDLKATPPGKIDDERFIPLQISKYANRGFEDDVADDGRGGWTDEGFHKDLHFFPQNISGYDMANLPQPAPDPKYWPSILALNGVSFRIIDPRLNNDKSCIVLHGYKTEKKGDYVSKVEGIPLNQKIRSFYSLHASALLDGAEEGKVLWYYILSYKDGEQVRLPVRYLKETAAWDNPRELSGASVAWIGSSLTVRPVCLYISEFNNPHPDKIISSLGIEAAPGEHVNGIIAISISVKY